MECLAHLLKCVSSTLETTGLDYKREASANPIWGYYCSSHCLLPKAITSLCLIVVEQALCEITIKQQDGYGGKDVYCTFAQKTYFSSAFPPTPSPSPFLSPLTCNLFFSIPPPGDSDVQLAFCPLAYDLRWLQGDLIPEIFKRQAAWCSPNGSDWFLGCGSFPPSLCGPISCRMLENIIISS